MVHIVSAPAEKTVQDEECLQQLVYGISHSMGAPLRGITQFSKLLQQTATGRLEEKEKYWFELIQQNGETAQQMIDALLRYSRIATTADSEQDFSVKQLTESVIQQCVPGGATLEVDDQLHTIRSYPAQWTLLLQELLRNAVLYQPQENQHRVVIRISWFADAEDLILRVEDNGIGVNEASLELITAPFKRLQSSDDYPGIGMGLAFCDRIAQLQNGRLQFSSSDLGGLKVDYRVPVVYSTD